MIDYNKIKEANELAIKCDAGIWYYFDNNRDSTYEYELLHKDAFKLWGTQSFITNSIDELIIKLKELTLPQPKFKVGQTVFVTNSESEILEAIIIDDQSKIHQYKIQLSNGFTGIYSENSLFTTKEQLIQSQIDYWKNLLPKCNHESDTYSYIIQHSPRIYAKKCRKCNYFYDSDSINYLDKIGVEFTKDDSFLEICDGCSEHISCCDCPSECQNESDGRFHYKMPNVTYINSNASCSVNSHGVIPIYKCKKCGEYYR